jgi:hypothetical protein
MTAHRVPRKPSVALIAMFLVIAAVAQQEQWLEYHTGTDVRGYRWLELSTNPPPNVALPKLEKGALFGCWTNGLESGTGRWFCLDRQRKSGPCDRLFVDCNGNGRLDDESPSTTLRRDETSSYFDPVKIVFKGEDGPISYHLVARFYQFSGDRAQLLAGAGGWYEGHVTLAGKKHRLQLIDNTVNGAFNDQAANPYECDRVLIGADKGESELVDRYLGKFLEVDGQLFRIEIARDGAFLKVQKAEGVRFGTVRVPEAISEFIAVGESGHFVRKPAKGEFTLPVGHYRVHGWTIDRKDDKGTAWSLSGYSFSKTAAFAVAPENPVTVKVGEPVSTALQATESRNQMAFSLRLQGNLGESVEIMQGKDRPRAPQLKVSSLSSDFRSVSTFQYG